MTTKARSAAASLLGKASAKKMGRKRLAEAGRTGGLARDYKPCTKYRAHVWNKQGVCYGCKLPKSALLLKGEGKANA